MRVRSELYRSPHFSNDQSTPHFAALHTGLRSGHTSGIQDVNLFPSWMTLRRRAHPWRGGTPVFKQERYSPLDGAVLSGPLFFMREEHS
jgi:hypothetical protein